MWYVSSDFKEKIKDGHSKQDFWIVDSYNSEMVLSWSAGNFSSDGIEIRRAVNEATDLTLGEAPAATLNCKLADPYGDLIEFWTWQTYQSHNTYLWGQAYIGVKLSGEPITLSDGENIRIPVEAWDDYVFSGRDDGFYINGVATSITDRVNGIYVLYNSTVQLLQQLNVRVYCDNHAYYVNLYSNSSSVTIVDVTSSWPTFSRRQMYGKGVLTLRETTTSYRVPTTIWQNGEAETWEWCPVGLYKLYRPRDNWDMELQIADAYDKMAEFDKGLYETYTTLPSLVWPTTIGNLVTTICSLCGVNGSSLDSTPVNRNPFSSDTTCRQVIRWAVERGGGMYYIDPVGTLEAWGPSFDAEPVLFLPNQIEEGSVAINDYKVPSPDCLEVRTVDERVYVDGSGDNVYVISGNPFFDIGVGTWPTVDTVDFPSYDPCTFAVIDADPSYGYGDIFQFIVYDRSGSAVAKMGFVMKETLTFDGRTHALYESSGSEIRENNNNYTQDNIQSMSNKQAEFFDSGGWVGYRFRNYLTITKTVDFSGVDVNYAWGNIFTGDGQHASVPQQQYPVVFTETPVVVAQLVSSGGSDGWLSCATDYTTQDLKEYTPAYEVSRGTARTGISFSVCFFVMGLIY